MFKYKTTLSFAHFKDLMMKFSGLVKEGDYNKVEYQFWRHLQKQRPLSTIVTIYWDNIGCDIEFENDMMYTHLVFKDNDLAQFLWDEELCFKERMGTDNDQISSLAATSTAAVNTYCPDFWESNKTTSGLTTNTIKADGYGLTIGSWLDGTVEFCDTIDDKLAVKADKSDLEDLRKQVDAINKKNKTDNVTNDVKENKKMKFNFDFGPVDSNSVRMSMYGLAIKNRDGVWVSYDSNGKQIMDVEIMNFDGSNFMYKMPVAIKDVKPGDVIVHNRKPMFVSDISKMGITAMDIYEGELKIVVPTANMFGFNFVTKIVSLVNFGTPTEDQPFGNMLPFLLMSEGKNDKNSMLMMAMAMNGGMNANMMSNPLMMIALMGDKDIDSGMLMYLAMQNQAANTHCNCGCHDGENK